jgi:hypothetical protein
LLAVAHGRVKDNDLVLIAHWFGLF